MTKPSTLLAGTGLSGLPDGRGLNIAYEAVDRHVAAGRGDHVALRFLAPPSGGAPASPLDVTYASLAESSARFANALGSLGVEPGETVATLTGRVPELYSSALGTLKARAVYCPLFSAYGPDPVQQRLARGDARVVITTAAAYERKIAPARSTLPGLRHVIITDPADGLPDGNGVVSYAELVRNAESSFAIAPTDSDDPALLHFTSGTTGNPKGAVHVHLAVVAHHATAAEALGLRPQDVFWCTADPGWVTGTSYGIVAPLTHGVTTVIDPADFDPERWYRTLESQRVTVWYTAPTAIRLLMRAGAELAGGHDLSTLRVVASVGEPLNPEAVLWGADVLGTPIRDNWWQTETGGIMIANRPDDEVRPGSMGRPLSGIDAAIVAVDDENEPVLDGAEPVLAEDDVNGMLAIRRGWASMFRGYLNDEERYRRCFAGDWYLSGDLARRDKDGWYWFVGRADDVVKTAGHLVGPFEVESALMEHPAVAEAAVIGLPDPVAGNLLRAFVTLNSGHQADEATRRDIQGFGRKRLGSIAPKRVEIVDDLPHTRSGKVMRRLLRARALGLDEGDVSGLGTA